MNPIGETMLKTVTTRVAQIVGPREVVFDRETLVLEGMGPREVAAETLYTAISPGSELAAYEGLRPLRPDRAYSKVVGYCNVARVIGTGDWVRRFRPGDVILSLESHRSHFVCGEEEVLLALPRRPLSEQMLQEAATTYLFHQGYTALLRGDLKPGQYVGVIGLGTLGLATVAVADRFGARAFGFSDRAEARRRAEEFGARRAFAKKVHERESEMLREATGATGLDIVVLTSSAWQDWRLALELARPGGKVCVLGFPGRRQPTPPFNPLDPGWFYRKQLSLIACGYTPDVEIDPRDIRFTIRRNCAYLLDLILEGRLPARRLISAVEPWHRLPAVYERLAAREPGVLTAVLRWQGECDDA